MKIQSIQAVGIAYEIPAERAYGSAVGLHQRRQFTLIRLRTDDGIEGIGDARAPVSVVRAHLDVLKSKFIGTDINDREIIFARLLNQLYHFGRQGPLTVAYSGLNIAMLDALGKARSIPVSQVMGGSARGEVAAYATGGHLTRREADLVGQLERIKALGVAGAKIKIGLGPESDEMRVATARRILGDDMFLAVDANANYTCDVAVDSMRRMAPHNIAWFEEPLRPYDYRGYSYLRARAMMPIAAGEAHHMIFDFKRLLEGLCLDIAQPAVCGCGGLDEARRIADLCRLFGIRVIPAAWSSGVGLMAAIHFAASIPAYPHADTEPAPQFVEYDASENPLRDEILQEPVKLLGGKIAVSDKPGLGVNLNEDAVRFYQVG
jgi:D-galactarolactone cycloisomerase